MFTYTTEPLVIDGSGKPIFPAVVSYSVTFDPTIPFGVGKGRSRTVFGTVRLRWDKSSGEIYSETRESQLVETVAQWENLPITFVGPELRTTMRVQDEGKFKSLLAAFYWYLPVVLGFHLREPIRVARFELKINDNLYNVYKSELPSIRVITTDVEIQQLRIQSSVKDLDLLYSSSGSISSNRPLIVAMRYYLIAQELILAGSTPTAFLPEILLNYAKILEALWGNDREDIRKGLRDLDVPEDEIECVFIPVCLLRNSVDVAHASVSQHESPPLHALRKQVEALDGYFVNLIERLFKALREGNMVFREGRDSNRNSAELDKIILSLDKRPECQQPGSHLYKVKRSPDGETAPGLET